MQEQLAEQIVIVERNLSGLSINSSFVEEYSEGHKRVLVIDKSFLETVRVFLPQNAGWQMVVGAEEFLNAPTWWYFGNVERGSLLAESAEGFKQAGLVSYF